MQQQPRRREQAAVEPVVPQPPSLSGATAVMRGGTGPLLMTLLSFVVAHRRQRSRGVHRATLLREENTAPGRKIAAGLPKRSPAARPGSPRAVIHPARRLLPQLRAAAEQPLRQIR